MNMEIRKINEDEYSLIADMFNQYRIFYKQVSDIALAGQYLKERLANNEAQIFVACNKNTKDPVGFTLLYPKFSSVAACVNWHIGDLYVEPASRRQGIGARLLDAAKDFASLQNARYISLNTAKDNYTAQKVYEDFGFIQQAWLPDYLYYQFELK